MKKIKIKFVDIDNSKKLDCFLREKSDWNLIKSCLQKHYEVIETDKDPEYIFCYVPVGNAKGFEYGTYKNAVRCFVQLESVWPNFYSFDYAIGMEHNLAFGSRYLYLPGMIYCNELTNSLWDDVRTKHLNCETELFHRKFCSFTVSNVSDAAEERKKFFQLLSSYKPVDSGGALYNNLGHRVVDKQAFDLEHKFSICFENSWYCLVSDKLPM